MTKMCTWKIRNSGGGNICFIFMTVLNPNIYDTVFFKLIFFIVVRSINITFEKTFLFKFYMTKRIYKTLVNVRHHLKPVHMVKWLFIWSIKEIWSWVINIVHLSVKDVYEIGVRGGWFFCCCFFFVVACE